MIGRLLRRRDVLSWCLYDWANSAFVTSVITVVLPVYFLTLIPEDGPARVGVGRWAFETTGPALWSYLTAFYMLAAAVVSPLLGPIADQARSRRKFLAACVFPGAILTACLALATPGRHQLCGLLFVGAAFLWSCGNLFYDSLLPHLARKDRELDTISNAGYAFGYLGGGVLLAVNLVMVTKPDLFGFADAGAATRAAFITVGIWWAMFSIPLLLFVRERDADATAPRVAHPVRAGLRRLWRTLREIRQYRDLALLLVAFICYNTGIGTVFVEAAIFGRDELNLPQSTLIACILMIQFVGFPATFGFIALARRLGTRGAIFSGILVYIGVVCFAYFMTSAVEFWILGAAVALVQGGTQALSRSLYGSMLPEGRSAEFFGFFSIFEKVGTFAGPLTFGLVHHHTGSSRLAILFIAAFFVLGLVFLALVNVRRGRSAIDTSLPEAD